MLDIKITEKEKGCFVIAVGGELNTETAPELESKIEPVLKQKILVLLFNLKDLTYISSLGLAVFFKIRTAIKKDKGSLVFCNTPEKIQKVFDSIKFIPDQVFTSMKEADVYLDLMFARIQKKN